MSFGFRLIAGGGRGPRCGKLITRYGEVTTPVFMPVGTHGAVKACTSEDLVELGIPMVLANTYHLYLRPGHEVIRDAGGLHAFMNWHRPILTDSGGFQIYSLSALRRVAEDGVMFRSHLDGSEHVLTPSKTMAIQKALDADIVMVLDECIPFPAPYAAAETSVGRTVRWALQCREAEDGQERALFGIVQGGTFPDLRYRCADLLCSIGFEGYGIGGLGVGEDKETMFAMIDASVERLPIESPRYLMGIGSPEDLVEAVARGIDMFDCVIPTRNARNGAFFTRHGKINIKNTRYSKDNEAIDAECNCLACRKYSRAYLRHLFLSKELSVYRLISMHNLLFYQTLMERMQCSIIEGRFETFRSEFYASWTVEHGREGEAAAEVSM